MPVTYGTTVEVADFDDREAGLLMVIVKTLSVLDEAARRRIVAYLYDRVG